MLNRRRRDVSRVVQTRRRLGEGAHQDGRGAHCSGRTPQQVWVRCSCLRLCLFYEFALFVTTLWVAE
jgi:hypothetical protein